MNNNWENLVNSYADKIKTDFPIVEGEHPNLKSFIQIGIPDDIEWEQGQKHPLYRAVHKDSDGHTFYGQWLEDGNVANRELIVFQRGTIAATDTEIAKTEILFPNSKENVDKLMDNDMVQTKRAIFRYLKDIDAYSIEFESFDFDRWGLNNAHLSLPSETAAEFLANQKERYPELFSGYNLQFEYPTEDYAPLKRMKEMFQLGMSELKSQHRNYNGKWGEWRSVKEEWLNLASEENNLSDRAGWSIEGCQRKIREAALQAIHGGMDKAAERYSAKAIYAALQPELDPDGFYLLRAAEKITGFDVVKNYPVEDNLHHFEAQSGFGMMRYLEAAKFGECTYKPVAPGTEVLETYIIHSDTPQFMAYQDSVFVKALFGIIKSSALTCDFKQFVSVAANMQSFEQAVSTSVLTPQASPKDGWVSISDHLKEYAMPYVDDEAAYYDEQRKIKMPDNTDYRLHESFLSPDLKIPDDFQLPKTPPMTQSGVSKLQELFTPARVSARLQNDLKILNNNANIFREYAAILDESITEMKDEIAQMRDNAAQAYKEIKSGEPFNEWMRLNLESELSAFGLDPKTATMWDLTNKLGQFAPGTQANAQTEALQFAEQASI